MALLPARSRLLLCHRGSARHGWMWWKPCRVGNVAHGKLPFGVFVLETRIREMIATHAPDDQWWCRWTIIDDDDEWWGWWWGMTMMMMMMMMTTTTTTIVTIGRLGQLTTTISSTWQDSLDHFVSEQALFFNELILVKILWIDNVFSRLPNWLIAFCFIN